MKKIIAKILQPIIRKVVGESAKGDPVGYEKKINRSIVPQYFLDNYPDNDLQMFDNIIVIK